MNSSIIPLYSNTPQRSNFRKTFRLLSVLICTMFLAVACNMTDSNLSPSQRALRADISEWDNPDYSPTSARTWTVIEGTVIGAALTGLATYLISGGNTRAALAAALAGGAVGYRAGHAVADNAEMQANAEAALRGSIQRANADAAKFQSYAQSARAVTAQAEQHIAQLDARYRAGQLTAAQFRQQTDVYRRDLDAMNKLQAGAGRTSTAMGTVGNQTGAGALNASAGQVNASRGEMGAAANALARALLVVPSA